MSYVISPAMRAVLQALEETGKGVRVRHEDGWLGWRKEGVIRPDYDPVHQLVTYWMTNSPWDQEDFGLPPAGWYTAYGWWQDVES